MTVFRFLSSSSDTLSNNYLDQIIALYRQAGWWESPHADRGHVRNIVLGSHCFLVALINGELIGMGRAISDDESDAYIQDVTVKKKYRQEGIGTEIVKLLTERLEADGIKWIGLIAERNTHKFYERIGFKQMPNASPMLKKS